ncbi:SRP54-type protein, GTPase domain protein, partial [Ostertagia ostertagi]
EGADRFVDAINTFVKDVLIQERALTQYKYNDMTIKFKLDNEFELVFVVIYQSAMQLSYTDKLLSDVRQKFRDMYKNVLLNKQILYQYGQESFRHFESEFLCIRDDLMRSNVQSTGIPKKPRTFQESVKSQKTIDSMIISRPGDGKKAKKGGREAPKKVMRLSVASQEIMIASTDSGSDVGSTPGSPSDEIAKRREVLLRKMNAKKPAAAKTPEIEPKKKGKQARVWELSGDVKNNTNLDYFRRKRQGCCILSNFENSNARGDEDLAFISEQRKYVGRSAQLQGFSDGEDDDAEEIVAAAQTKGSWFGAFKNLVGNKQISAEDIEPVLETMRENLILKNVAAEPADKICQSVARKLEGKVVSTFSRVSSEVKEAVRESLTQLLTPKRRVDILRDIVEAKREGRPYVVVFCGVNGVGKSTNLAKITFWLNENNHRVLIAAGDTFRAGAVEQLRTHTKHLNALHPNSVQLFEQGYGKDSASLAAAAIGIAAERAIDVVLVDTAGRMQDNEPLMRELAKLIRVNEPDLVLFVGEALVGNEAVDQLVKFNQALADNATPGSTPRLIDGIVLTKFDTIDDKVGAAVSMAYITGQPIVFVGCGQTYKDLRNLNIGAVVSALLK